MGLEYYKVLRAQGMNPVVIGRGGQRAELFKEQTGCDVIVGGVEKALTEIKEIPQFAIVAVGTDSLSSVTVNLIRAGIQNVLVEKPAGLSRDEIEAINNESKKYSSNVFVAYNRRFYASVEKAKSIIDDDGGVTSLIFEFTEWSNKIVKIDHPISCKENFLLANSTHVIDLAFYFAGHPAEISSYVRGGLSWHKNGSIYAGAGYTDRGVVFSYSANWEAPGRWSVEVLTKKHRLYLRPMEKLSVQIIDSVKIDEVELDDKLDTEYKPGIYNEVNAFLHDQKDERLVSINEHTENLKWYEKIAGL